METYRVFVKRYYISVKFFDVEAKTAKSAKTLTKKAAKKLYQDVRERAIDNGWIPEEPTSIEYLGYPSEPRLVEIVSNKYGTAYQQQYRDEDGKLI